MTDQRRSPQNPADALASAADLPDGSSIRVSLFVEVPAESELRGFALNPAGGLASEFRESAQSFAKTMLAKRTLIQYNAGRKPEEYELVWLELVKASELRTVLSRAESATPMGLSDPSSGDAKRLRLLVVSVSKRLHHWIHFVRQTSIRARLARSRKIAAVLRDGAYDRLEADVLLFDTTYDAIVSDGMVFIENQREFERGVSFTQGAAIAAAGTLQAISAKLRIRNYDTLVAAAIADANMIAKLRGIQAKMSASVLYADAMTMDRLVPFIKSSPQLQIDLEGPAGHEEFVFYPDIARRWRILKLLDDDYLYSKLTEINYDSNSKMVMS
jgi:hypothetical protein